MIPRFSKSCKNPGNSLYTKWNLLIKILKEMKLLKPLTHNIFSVVRTDDINIVLFMSKCKIQFFPLDFMPLLGNGAAICQLQKSRKSIHCTSWRPWDHLAPLLFCFKMNIYFEFQLGFVLKRKKGHKNVCNK